VLEFYEGRDNPFSLARVMKEYAPRVLLAEANTPCFMIYSGTPIGYMQYYPITDQDKSSYGLDAGTDVTNVYGTDQFVGEPEYWNRGLGTRAVSLLLMYLFKVRGARSVVIDPQTGNLRAIRCYEKCGFQKVKILPQHELHEGKMRDSWLMQAFPKS